MVKLVTSPSCLTYRTTWTGRYHQNSLVFSTEQERANQIRLLVLGPVGFCRCADCQLQNMPFLYYHGPKKPTSFESPFPRCLRELALFNCLCLALFGCASSSPCSDACMLQSAIVCAWYSPSQEFLSQSLLETLFVPDCQGCSSSLPQKTVTLLSYFCLIDISFLLHLSPDIQSLITWHLFHFSPCCHSGVTPALMLICCIFWFQILVSKCTSSRSTIYSSDGHSCVFSGLVLSIAELSMSTTVCDHLREVPDHLFHRSSLQVLVHYQNLLVMTGICLNGFF